MLKVVERYFRTGDARGSLEGLVNFGEWRELNLVTSLAGAVRGGHYHLRARELFVILDGTIRVVTQRVEDGRLVGETEERKVGPGDVILVEPLVNHTFHILGDARWLNLLSIPMDPSAPDIHRPR
jgi:mannose-6-phosphate isomerase-like protein (cupin superfamily)